MLAFERLHDLKMSFGSDFIPRRASLAKRGPERNADLPGGNHSQADFAGYIGEYPAGIPGNAQYRFPETAYI